MGGCLGTFPFDLFLLLFYSTSRGPSLWAIRLYASLDPRAESREEVFALGCQAVRLVGT